jgi:hypothetical protein
MIPRVKLEFAREDGNFTHEVEYKVGDSFFLDREDGMGFKVTVESITTEYSKDMVEAINLLKEYYTTVVGVTQLNLTKRTQLFLQSVK